MRVREVGARAARIIIGLGGVAVLWEVAELTGAVNPGLVPEPMAVAVRMVTLWGDPAFRVDLLATTLALGRSLLLTVVIGVPAGLVLGTLRPVRIALAIPIDVMRSIPAVAAIPLAVVTLGDGAKAEVVLATLAGVWPVAIAVTAGVRDIDPALIEAARVFGRTRVQVALQVALRAVTRDALIAIRLAAAIELVVIVSTEIVAGLGNPGVGTYLSDVREAGGDGTIVLAGAMVTGALGCGLSLALRYVPWRPWHDKLVAATVVDQATMRRSTRAMLRWGTLTMLCAAWEVATRATGSPFAPTPATIAAAARSVWLAPVGLDDIGVSLKRLSIGWAIAVVVGVGGGLLLGRLPRVAEVVEAPAALLRAIPPVLLLPVEYAWVEIGTPLVIVTIATGAVWPILMMSIDAVRGVDAVMLDVARTCRVGVVRLVATVILPAALPKILTGARISLGLALILLVVSEISAATSGIGYEVGAAQAVFDYPVMWAWIVLIGALGYASTRGLLAVTRWVAPWHPDATH
jgi:ABC-type nitrate/sulfonate/bicarbonate transport system permease component